MSGAIRLLLTGGGTGGHLFPAVAVAEEIGRQLPGSRVHFVGTKRKLDRERLTSLGFEVSTIDSQGLKGKKLTSLVSAMVLLPISFFQAMQRIRKFQPDLVLGVGGYVTGPVLTAARTLGIKTVIHEQNSVPGLANRKLGGLVNRVCLSLPGSESYFPAAKVRMTGNPVRSDLRALAEKKRSRQEGEKCLLILGGSLGAHGVNLLVSEALCEADGKLSEGLTIIHQTGEKDEEMVRDRYRQAGLNASVHGFIADMAAVYDKADFLVSRAGATTLAELGVLGKPALLIPYPHAADNHQRINGDHYVKGGGAVLFEESELTPEKLRDELFGILTDGKKLEVMSDAMKKLGSPAAAENIVEVCLELLADA
ncbi:MAG: undecaprenyldiphospho-muramoylpentapeptide beta-N-acetylglucosaminyltransferase [Thermodesulfobacteriota bacterium]